MKPRILALLDERDGKTLDRATAEVGGTASVVYSVDKLLRALRENPWDLTVVSLGADMVDEALLERVAGLESTGTLLLCGRGASLQAALLSERIGAAALLRLPLDASALDEHLAGLQDEGRSVRLPGPADRPDEASLVGESAEMASVFGLIAKVSRSSSTVLLTGESGTGKEVVARTLHEQSERREHEFVAVNCAAIPENLLESELFGHEKGAFTGAVAKRTGRFQRAHRGTLFLDEIGDMSLVLQAKVLRALEERRVERVGGHASEAVDVRVVAATNQRLGEAIEEGRFREDLYYRLAVVEIELPPLRTRGEDVRLLAMYFAALFAERHGRSISAISTAALERIEAFDWPGNVRELRNVMDRAVLLTSGSCIRSGALRLGAAAPRASSRPDAPSPHGYPETASLAEVETDHIRRVLESVEGQIGRAADILGIHRNTLSRKIQEYGLDEAGGGAR
ncbi:MAG: sigma-54 dependent transcriptional regulator [Gemmatimonadota bacterium]|nr:sigma-54 dependent transcriptional regulator [Gemmatimonadota bacterium]